MGNVPSVTIRSHHPQPSATAMSPSQCPGALGFARAAEPQESVGRLLSDCIALAKQYEAKFDSASAADPDFARDVQEFVDSHWEPIRNVWEFES